VYTRQAGSPQKKLSGLELQIAELRALISARGSADIRLVPSARVFGFDIGRLAGKKTEVVAPATAAVPEKEPLPSTSSDLAFSNLQILPDRVTQGSSVGVIATITNDGWGEVQRKIEFKVNGKMQAFENVALAPGESQEVTFVTIGQEPGDYEVEVGDLAGRFKVLPAASAVR